MEEYKRVDLSEHWATVQEVMACELKAARRQPHYGSAGDASEYDWAEWLEHYLPSRYAVCQDAFVVNSEGLASDQLDVVIYDRHFTPRIWVHKGKLWVPAESVYAVVECKPELNRDYTLYAGRKVASVRHMYRTGAEFFDNSTGTMRSVAPKYILGLLLCDRSGWALPLGEPFNKALLEQPAEERLDIVCAVEAVAASVRWTEAGTPTIRQVGEEHALIGFFSELIKALQGIGTVAAIDYDQYTRELNWRS